MPVVPERALPSSVDVLIVGAGYTGLSAARETAAAGRSTLVLDAGALGAGCSGRNGGQVAYSFKPSLATLSARYGEKRAYEICHEGRAALDYLRTLATSGGIDCDWRQRGCFYGAHTRASLQNHGEGRAPSDARPRAADHRRAESAAAAGACERFLSWRLRVPRRCVGGSHAAAARAIASSRGQRRCDRGSLRGAGHSSLPRRVRDIDVARNRSKRAES